MLQFLKDNQQHRREAQDHICRGLTQDKVIEYEKLYKQVLDPKFIVNRGCSSCIADMVQRIWRWYDRQCEAGILLDFQEVTTSVTLEVEPMTEWQSDEMPTEIKLKNNGKTQKNRKP